MTANRMRRFVWHTCSTCYWMDAEKFCCFAPELVPVHEDRWGCSVWECAGCNGPFDEQDAEGNFIDHGDCMHGIIEIVS